MGNYDACSLPSRGGDSEYQVIQRLIQSHYIAIVGLSDDPTRPSFEVASYLLSAGKQIIPVNPNHTEVLGLKCYPSLQAIPRPVDLVNIFRRSEFCPQIVRDAIAIKAKAVWLQSGIHSPDARKLAHDEGLDYIEDRCLMVEHRLGVAAQD